jgi:hypothetical protein
MNAPVIAALCFCLSLASAAHAQERERIMGSPGKDPRVTLAVRDGAAGDVLAKLAERAGWSLAAGGDHLVRKVSVQSKNRPASEVLATVLEVAGLQARFQSSAAGVSLVVQDAEAPATAVAPLPPEAPPAAPVPPATAAPEAPPPGPEEKPARRGHHASHDPDRVMVGEDVEIAAGETVGDVVCTGCSVTVRGHASGDAMAVGGSVTVEPGGRIDGDAVAVGGSVDVKPGASVRGERSAIGGPVGKVLAGAIKLSPSSMKPGRHHDQPGDRDVLGRLWWLIPFFVLGFLLMLFAPNRLLSLREALSARPWAATAAGVGSWFGIVALCVLLAVTLIGIPLIPLALVGFCGLGLFGLTSLAWWTGAKLSFVPGTDRPLVAFSLGTLVLVLVAAIPFFGPVTLMLATTVSGGAALLLLISDLRRRRVARNPPPALAP